MQRSTIRIGESHNALLFVADGRDFEPQETAMLQAFYSRSLMSIEERVADMNSDEVKDALQKYYLNYGHRSIGQCGNFTMFVEDVSIFAAKAIQHHPLYNGQETSTRYYDFAEREIIDPVGLGGYLDGLRAAYIEVVKHAKQAYLDRAVAEGHKLTAAMERTCAAKAFDVSRCLLTAGFTTKLSWTTNFDQVQEQLRWLINSPAPELNSIALGMAETLHAAYPKSIAEPQSLMGSTSSIFDRTESIAQSIINYDDCEGDDEDPDNPTAVHFRYSSLLQLRRKEHREDLQFLRSRQRHTPVPKAFSAYGRFDFAFNIDYGSFRDLHRHRNGTMYFPHYPTSRKMMHPWYVDELTSLGVTAKPFGNGTIGDYITELYARYLPSVSEAVAKLHAPDTQEYHATMMYYVPMGTLVRAAFSCDLPQAVYIAELRSGRTVHQTARIAARGMAAGIYSSLPVGIKLHIDTWEGLSERRGTQTIFDAYGESVK